jgi:hypothetical protein
MKVSVQYGQRQSDSKFCISPVRPKKSDSDVMARPAYLYPEFQIRIWGWTVTESADAKAAPGRQLEADEAAVQTSGRLAG